MLGHLNKNQGLGFTLHGMVLDRSFFLTTFVRLGALTSTAIGSLLALAPKAASSDAEGLSVCTPTADQIAVLAHTLVNRSCSYPMTVDSLLLVGRK